MSAPERSLPFEEALGRLEELVDGLEQGDRDLEQSLRDFEEGVRLVRLCQERLQAAELRLKQLEEGPQGLRERALAADEEPAL